MAEWIELGKEVAKLGCATPGVFRIVGWVPEFYWGSLCLASFDLIKYETTTDGLPAWYSCLPSFCRAVEIILLPKNRLIAYADERHRIGKVKAACLP